MSAKRKWDQQADDASAPATSNGDAAAGTGKTANDAAAAAAAIAAKIAAQFAGGAGGSVPAASKDPHDGDFIHNMDINDLRNRYVLTRGTTQQEINEETGASVSTKGVWYPDRSKAEKEPPLYLHISANSQEMLDRAIAKVNEIIALDLGPLTDDKMGRREKRKWPDAKIPLGVDTIRNFNVRAKVVGPQGLYVKYIQQETSARVQIKGIGSGFIEQETGKESDEPMYVHVTAPEDGQVARAKTLTEDLVEVVQAEHAKAYKVLEQQQAELHAAQMQYAQYAAQQYGYTLPQGPGQPAQPPPPPPPGGDAPPPPPSDPAQQAQAQGPPPATDAKAFADYWAQYGYDTNSQQFKDWQTSQAAAIRAQQQAPPPPPADGAPPPPPA